MQTNSVVPLRDRNDSSPVHELPWRRVSHGSTRFARASCLRQPQDGAEPSARVASIKSRLQPTLAEEPEDARLTGLTRSLNRRLLGLNVIADIEPATPRLTPGPTLRKPQPRNASVPERQVHVA